MSILRTLHDDLVAIENRAHELAAPEEAIAKALRNVIGCLVADVETLKERVFGLENVAPAEQPPEPVAAPVADVIAEHEATAPFVTPFEIIPGPGA